MKGMTAMDYRELIQKTRNNALTPKEQLGNGAIGLCGEAGEVADLIKKHLYQGHPLDREKMIKELGDCYWYLELLCDMIDVTRSEVESVNTNKLLARYPNGFNVPASVNRLPESK